MKRIYIVAGIILILGASLVIEYYTETRFPTRDLVITGVPELVVGETRTFTYMRELQSVGSYSYTIESFEDGLYTVTSSATVSEDESSLNLMSEFLFDASYNPSWYHLIVDQGGDVNIIEVTFTDEQVISEITMANDTVTLTDEYTEGLILTENNMPGYWELLLLSAELESGERYTVDAYIPQGGTVFELEFYVNPNPQSIIVGGEQIRCTVIQENTLDLRFYLYEGRMIQMRNDDQDLTFTLVS